MLRGVNVLLALILSQGWQWARLLEEHRLIGGISFAVFAVCSAVLFFIHQFTGGFKEPASRDKVRARAAVLDNYLQSYVSSYYKLVVQVRGTGATAPHVRANIMLPVVDWFGIRKRLQICYKGCPPWCQYGRDELDLYWNKKCGVVGWVWKSGQAEAIEINDENRSHDALNTVPATHINAVKKVESILSVPILENGKPIGVLSLDGQEKFDRTLFDSNDVKVLAERYAQGLPSLCFSHGVRPR